MRAVGSQLARRVIMSSPWRPSAYRSIAYPLMLIVPPRVPADHRATGCFTRQCPSAPTPPMKTNQFAIHSILPFSVYLTALCVLCGHRRVARPAKFDSSRICVAFYANVWRLICRKSTWCRRWWTTHTAVCPYLSPPISRSPSYALMFAWLSVRLRSSGNTSLSQRPKFEVLSDSILLFCVGLVDLVLQTCRLAFFRNLAAWLTMDGYWWEVDAGGGTLRWVKNAESKRQRLDPVSGDSSSTVRAPLPVATAAPAIGDIGRRKGADVRAEEEEVATMGSSHWMAEIDGCSRRCQERRNEEWRCYLGFQ